MERSAARADFAGSRRAASSHLIRFSRASEWRRVLLGSVRRECLDHVFILGERHLERVLREYCFDYFNPARSHQGIGQLVPAGSACSASGNGPVVAVPVLGGLHHDYRRAA
jgi:putative transposase